MTILLTNPRERTRFLRFAVVGIIGLGVDFGVSILLFQVFSVPFVWAGTISFIAAILSNFTWNRYWTYPDSRSKTVGRQLAEFVIVSVAGLIIRIPILAFLEPVITHQVYNLFIHSPMLASLEPAITYQVYNLPVHIPIFDPEFIGKIITLAIAVIIVMFWNFFVNRYWTYRDVE